jgi:hypothetical protein
VKNLLDRHSTVHEALSRLDFTVVGTVHLMKQFVRGCQTQLCKGRIVDLFVRVLRETISMKVATAHVSRET